MSDPQDQAEALDDDLLAGEHPPEVPQGVNEAQVTPQGEWLPEPLEERVEREEPEAAPPAGEPPADDHEASDADAPYSAEGSGGRLAPERVPPSAEEQALHEAELDDLAPGPPSSTADAPVDDTGVG